MELKGVEVICASNQAKRDSWEKFSGCPQTMTVCFLPLPPSECSSASQRDIFKNENSHTGIKVQLRAG